MLTGTTLDGPMVWRVETQQRYGRDKGVQHPSKPDFIFKPQSGRLVKDRPDLLSLTPKSLGPQSPFGFN